MKLEFSRQIFKKYPNIKFHENPSGVCPDVPCGQTDRHDEANRRFSQFCERASKQRSFTSGNSIDHDVLDSCIDAVNVLDTLHLRGVQVLSIVRHTVIHPHCAGTMNSIL
jgi:hypothetical protein